MLCAIIMLSRYYYCARPASVGESEAVKFETGGIYTIVLGDTNNEEVIAGKWSD